MALTWSIDHDARLVALEADGPLGQRDITRYMAEATARGAAGYRALFDARAAEFELGSSEIANLSDMVRGRGTGAIAFVVSSEAEREMADHFARRTAGQRPCRVFSTVEDARAWLDSQA